MTAPVTSSTPPPFVPSTFVTVLGWLGIILFGCGIAMGVVQSVMFGSMYGNSAAWPTVPDSLRTELSPEAIEKGMAYLRYGIIAVAALMALGLAASIGLLHRKNWARLTTLGFLFVSIAWTAVSLFGLYGTAGVPFPATAGGPPGIDMQQMMKMMRVVFYLFGVATVVVSGWLIKRLMSPTIRAEFMRRVA